MIFREHVHPFGSLSENIRKSVEAWKQFGDAVVKSSQYLQSSHRLMQIKTHIWMAKHINKIPPKALAELEEITKTEYKP